MMQTGDFCYAGDYSATIHGKTRVKMNPKTKTYDRNEKVHAVRRVIEKGHCPHRVAADLEVMTEELHCWIRRYATPSAKNSGRLRLKTPSDELLELRRERDTLTQERELLKKLTEGIPVTLEMVRCDPFS